MVELNIGDDYKNFTLLINNSKNGCFLESFIQGFYMDYKKIEDKDTFILNLKRELHDKLDEIIDSKKNLSFYSSLFNSKIDKVSIKYPQFSYETFKNNLLKPQISNDYSEYLSMVFEKDIYLLDSYGNVVCDLKGKDLYFKNRNSIVIIFKDNVYSTVSLLTDDGFIISHFHPKNDFIKLLNSKIV